MKKQKSKRYKRYIKKQIKKALDERLFKKFNSNQNKLPVEKLKINKSTDDIPEHNTWIGASF